MRHAGILLAATAACLGVAAASAAPLAFDASPDSEARRVVNVVFADYLRQRVGASVETAVLDLDNDRTGEIVARFVHTASCQQDMKACRTAVIRHDGQKWKIVLDRTAAAVGFEPHDGIIPGTLSFDKTSWKWNAGRYVPDGSGFGEEVTFQDVPGASAGSFAAAFGAGAQKLAAGGHGIGFSYSKEKLSDEAETMVVRMTGPTACGDLTGCPVRVLRKDGDAWSTVLSTSSKGGIALSDTVRGGYRDIVVETGLGYAVMGWTGSGYTVADRIEAIKAE